MKDRMTFEECGCGDGNTQSRHLFNVCRRPENVSVNDPPSICCSLHDAGARIGAGASIAPPKKKSWPSRGKKNTGEDNSKDTRW